MVSYVYQALRHRLINSLIPASQELREEAVLFEKISGVSRITF